MTLKKFACRFMASFLFVGGMTALLPAENIQLTPVVQAASQSSGNFAIDKYTQEIQQNPKDVDAYFNRGLMYNSEKNDKAIADFSMVIQLEPNKTRGYLHRGIAYRNAGQYDKAVQDFDKVISMEPQNSLNYLNRAMAHYLAKNYDKARADYNTVIKMGSGNSNLDPSVQETLAKLGVNMDYSSQGYYGLGLVDYDQKNYKAALENFNKAIDKAPEQSMFYESRAKCYKMLGDNAKAQADSKKAAELKRAEQSKIDRFTDSLQESLEEEIEIED